MKRQSLRFLLYHFTHKKNPSKSKRGIKKKSQTVNWQQLFNAFQAELLNGIFLGHQHKWRDVSKM